jgi:hypothetical protein
VGSIGNTKIDSMTNAQHIAYGLHSDIPNCCIKFYVTKWNRLHRLGISARSRDPKADYVRCDDCLTHNRLVKIHFCHSGCNEFLNKLWRFNDKS